LDLTASFKVDLTSFNCKIYNQLLWWWLCFKKVSHVIYQEKKERLEE